MGYRPAAGTTLSVKKAGESTYTEVGCIYDLSLDRGTRGSTTRACLSATNKIIQPGLSEPGELSFGIDFDPSDTMHVWLDGQLAASPQTAVHSWRINYPAVGESPACTDTFDGFVSGFTVDAADVDSGLEGSLTIALTSLPVLAEVEE